MNSFRAILPVTTKRKTEVVDITDMVTDRCRESGIREGLVLIFPHHTSAAVFINDADPGITEDFSAVLSRLVPAAAGYRHDETDHKKNADGHLKATLAGHHIVLPLTGGKPDLGTWQTLYYAEMDGCRTKEILVKIIGE